MRTSACGCAAASTSPGTGAPCTRTRIEMPASIDEFNAAALPDALRLLDGAYEHSPWVAERAVARRPFRSLSHLKHALAQIVGAAGEQQQLALLRAHPDLAGQAMAAGS